MELFPLLFLISLPLLLLLFFHPKQNQSSPNETSNLRAYPVVGHLLQFVKNRHRLLDWLTDLLAASPTNTITFRRLGNIRGVITANPAVVEHVLKTNFDNYPKGPRFISILEDLLGSGIFNSDGEQWRSQRKTASFEFNTKSLRHFVVENVRLEIAGRLIPLLERAAATGEEIDLQDVLERFAFDNVCKVAFNEDPGCLAGGGRSDEDVGGGGKHSSEFVLAFKDAANISAERFRYAIPRMWMIKKFLHMGSEKRLRESISIVHDFAMKIIRSRKKEKEKSLSSAAAATHDDLLSRFISGGNDISDEFLRDIVISFILAGRETTSSGLSWFFWLLSSRPGVEGKILEELKAVRARRSSGGGEEEEEKSFGFEELREMNYLHAAISESLRLYPPVAVDTMACREDDVLPDGTPVKAGWFVSYIAYTMGRMEAIWGEDCLEYRPERWLSEEEDGGRMVFRPESPYRFPVFHAGPRMCLGKEMAYIQMKSIAASVLERFTMSIVDGGGSSPEKMLSLTLRMRGGLPVRVRGR